MTVTRAMEGFDKVAFEKVRLEWASNLSVKLHEWCENNGYRPYSKLRRELDIVPVTWEHIMRGKSVADDATIYARLYLRTGLSEVDPRTIPPRVTASPRAPGRYYEKVRAWTKEQYENWRSDYQGPPSSVEFSNKIPKPGVIQAPKQAEPQGQGWGADLENAVRILSSLPSLLQELAPAIQDLSRKLDGQGREPNKVLTVKAAAAVLYDILHGAAVGTPADRDAFYKKHSKDLLPILPLISTLMKDRERRELEIDMMKSMEGVTG